MNSTQLALRLGRLSLSYEQSLVQLCPTQRRLLLRKASRRSFSTTNSRREELIKAAAEIDFDDYSPQSPSPGSGPAKGGRIPLLQRVRIVPASPSYFTGKPDFTDTLLELRELLRRHEALPQATEPPRIAFKTLETYLAGTDEVVTEAKYKLILQTLRRLARIHPALQPEEVKAALEKHKRAINPYDNKRKPKFVDEWGRALGVGRRKSSTARAYIVEGEGECIVNGRSLTEYFGRVHDRESALWALKVTGRLDRYNVWSLVNGGGVTGQAEAVLLAVANALVVMEPDLLPKLKFAGTMMRDPRRVERKKTGHLKARKMPTWKKR